MNNDELAIKLTEIAHILNVTADEFTPRDGATTNEELRILLDKLVILARMKCDESNELREEAQHFKTRTASLETKYHAASRRLEAIRFVLSPTSNTALTTGAS